MEKVSFVLASDALEKLHAVGLMASVAAMSQMDVRVFVTMNAVTAFRKETIEKNPFGWKERLVAGFSQKMPPCSMTSYPKER
jgi:Uncharacterized conserved protein